jgi:alginate O-acetyltransferase complex protein AlgJ
MQNAHKPGTAAIQDPPRLRRGVEWALIMVFLLAICVPGLATFAGVNRQTIEGENRELAPVPRLAWDRESLRALPDAFTRYFEDHFAFRAPMVEWQARVRLEYLGTPSDASVIKGKEGWLFYADDGAMEDYISAVPLGTDELEVWRRALQDTQDWLEGQGITYLFVIVPDKHVIYRDMMPDTIRRLHEEWRTDALVRYLAERSTVRVLDLRPSLAAAARHERIYHRTDTHWNDRGAFVGYQQIMERLDALRPGLGPWPRSAFEARVEVTEGRDLAGMLGLAHAMTEEDLRMLPRRVRCAGIVEESVPASKGSAARVVTECGTPGLPRAVIYRDSFASALVPFVSEHFSRALYLWERDVNPSVIAAERPDVVIQEWVGRRLSTALPYNVVADLNVERR